MRSHCPVCEVFPKEVSVKSTTNCPTIHAEVKHDFCARGAVFTSLAASAITSFVEHRETETSN
jgi:hypothetical protein